MTVSPTPAPTAAPTAQPVINPTVAPTTVPQATPTAVPATTPAFVKGWGPYPTTGPWTPGDDTFVPTPTPVAWYLLSMPWIDQKIQVVGPVVLWCPAARSGEGRSRRVVAGGGAAGCGERRPSRNRRRGSSTGSCR
jgi:hypothetical protein